MSHAGERGEKLSEVLLSRCWADKVVRVKRTGWGVFWENATVPCNELVRTCPIDLCPAHCREICLHA